MTLSCWLIGNCCFVWIKKTTYGFRLLSLMFVRLTTDYKELFIDWSVTVYQVHGSLSQLFGCMDCIRVGHYIHVYSCFACIGDTTHPAAQHTLKQTVYRRRQNNLTGVDWPRQNIDRKNKNILCHYNVIAHSNIWKITSLTNWKHICISFLVLGICTFQFMPISYLFTQEKCHVFHVYNHFQI